MMAVVDSGMQRIKRALAEAVSIAAGMGIFRPGMVVSGIVLNLLSLALPLAMLQIFDRIIPHAAFGTLTLLTAGLFLALVLEAAIRQVRAMDIAWEGARFDHRTAVALVGRLLNAPLGDIEAQPAGHQINRLNSIEPVREFHGQNLSLVLADIPFTIIFLALVYYIAGALVLAPLGLVIGYALLAWLTGEALHAALRERKEVDGRRYNFIIEVLSNIHTAKGLAVERLLQRRYERLICNNAALGWRVNYLSSMSEGFSSGFAQMTTVVVGAAGAWLVINGSISVGALAASTMLAGRSVQPLLRTLSLWTRYQSVRLNTEHLNAIGSLPCEPGDAAKPISEIAQIDLQDVCLRRRPDAPPLFEGLNLSIRRGETIGISGPNGCGKSTLLNLMMGNQIASAGQVLINGTPIADINQSMLRQHVAYLPQRSVLFKGTILDNLTRFDLDGNLEAALELSARLGLDRFFAAMSDGYETQVGDGVTTLPLGVVQRVGMVRALVGQPQVILFDEANSALDQAGDKMVHDLLASYRGSAAIVLVSFRPSILGLADRRYVVRDRNLSLVQGGEDLKASRGAA